MKGLHRIVSFGLVFLAFQTVIAAPPTDHDKSKPKGDNGGRRAPSVVEANSFNVTRPLGYYANRLGDDFVRDLAALDGNSHWIDGGSGEGVAVENYHQLGTNARAEAMTSEANQALLQRVGRRPANQRAYVTGLTYHMLRPGTRNYGNRLRFMSGRLMEDIPDAEIGKADLISDVYGVFAYSNRLDRAMAKYLTALKPNGKLYIFSAHMERTTIRSGGRDISALQWLQSIQGIRVERLGTSIRITRVADQQARIPRLTFVSDNNQSPPTRVFNSGEGTIDVPAATATRGPGADFTTNHRVALENAPPPLAGETIDAVNETLGYTAHPPRR